MSKVKTAILITGAFGGLGTALVEISRNLTNIEHIVATDIKTEVAEFYKEDRQVTGLDMDVSSEESIRKVHNYLQEKNISVKYIINAAAVAMFHPVSESTEALLDKTIKTNTYGPILTVSVFLNDLIKNKGRVVQISSVSVKLPTLFQPYPNSKVALEAFSTSMRQELKLHGIKLILIRPGAINTPLTTNMKLVSNPVEKSRYRNYFNRFIKMANADIGKMVQPTRVAQLVKKTILTDKPKQVYSINKNAKISLLTLFPKKWRDYFIVGAVRKSK